MYPNNIMPNYNRNMYRGGFGLNRRNNDRFIGGGFAVPFILGGITGGLLSRPNNFYGGPYPIPSPYPVPMPYYVNNYPATYSENYYYY